MNLEDQLVSLEYAKKLKELGIEQKSTFFWYEGYDCWLLHYIDYNHHETDTKIFIKNMSPCFSAFTCAELVEMFPVCTPLTIVRSLYNNYILSSYSRYENFEDDNLSNCMAKMLIYLLENNLTTTEEINKKIGENK